MQTTLKFDYKAFCSRMIQNYKTIYNLSDEDVENLPLDVNTILAWGEEIQENKIIEELKAENFDYVIERLGK